MFPGPTELPLIGYSIESIWTTKSKSNTSTPRANSQKYWQRENSQDGLSSCRCSTTSPVDPKTRKNANQVLSSFLSVRKDFQQDNGHSSDLDQKRNGIPLMNTVRKEDGTELQSKWCWQLQKAHIPVFRSTSPLSRGMLKCKGGGKLSIHFCADPGTIETFCRTIMSVNQLSIYGAVSDMCEECDTCHDRTGRPTHIFDRWSSTTRRSFAKIQRTNWKVITTRQSEQILYWCMILDHCWSRTVFHDERHWRIFTIHRFSGLSWVQLAKVYLAKRRRFIWTKRLDSRTRIGS